MMQAICDREFILQRVVHLLTSSADDSNTSNLILQLTLTELVKQVMRELAQAEESDLRQDNLLQQAIQATTQLIEEQSETALQWDLSPYFERIYRSQRWVAKEMSELGIRLQQARHGEVLRSPQVISHAPVPFRMAELGIRGAVEGLIAQPLMPCQLNMERLRQDYRVHGLNFPWEVGVDEITFIVEADGNILTFLEGFPGSVIEQARSELVQLASRLYVPIADG
ncbi:MAG: hypothetical protein DCF22_15790 [Leptolyngbya sp.]|nr:MAG: hypothetical protein DCF22_15790 [Leptolyngbya sp.]